VRHQAFGTAEPAGAERHGREARQSECAGASESNAWRLTETPYNFLFLPEVPNAIPILAGRISAQELNSLKENT
jgi:hypothetical protein